jgi:hypothetical protein
MREDEDALFRSANSAVNDFISFVWLMLAIEEDSGTDPAMVDLGAVVDSTLAAQSPQARAACLTVAHGVHGAYLRADAEARRRWPRTGTSIGSARDIDELARRLADAIISRYEDRTLGDIHAPVSAINRIPRTVARLLALREAPEWRFRVSSKGADIEVNPVGLLTGWLTGTSLPDLAQAYLAAAANRAWRIEQMVDAVTDHFEHYLAWTVGALVELVNSWLADAGIEERLCPDLGSYIRYGVNDPKALILMTSGIRSRRLAHVIAADLPADLEPVREQLRLRIARMGVAEWRTRYDASTAEVLDLLDFTRVRNRSLLRTLLETGNVTVELPAITRGLPAWSGPLTLEPTRGEPQPAPLAVYAEDQHIVTIAAQDHADLSAILDTGLAIIVEIDDHARHPALLITLPLADAAD